MEQLINFIIRPPRAEYDPNNDLLEQEFLLKGKYYRRKDLELKNSRREVLQCSHYMPINPEGKTLPCVIYCHGNSGCRADASEAAIILLSSNITVFTLDFSGSGLSGGEHVTLGWNEKDDLRAVVDYLRADGNVSLIGLWGRSMGAVSSLMYGAEDPSIAGMVLDSPFSDLVDLMMELVDTYKVRLPKFTVKYAIQYMRRAIQKKAKFDIMDLNTIKVAQSSFVPALFGHAADDDFICPHHSDRTYEAYMGDKNIIKFEGDHNSPRPQFYFDSINIFFHNVLRPPDNDLGDTYTDSMHDFFGKGNWRMVPELAYGLGSPTAPKETAPNSTVDAIKQVRERRPMSRMEVPSDVPSTDNQSDVEGEKTDEDSSASRMISFELSNGHPYGPHIPATIDDDQFVEYPLDDLLGFPSSAEEEERMLMEAILESLKDGKMQSPKSGEQVAQKDDPETCHPEHSEVLQTDSTLTSAKQCFPYKKESTSTLSEHNMVFEAESTSLTSGLSSASELPSPDKSESSASVGPTSDAAPALQEPGNRGALDTDLAPNTKATVTVVRNPTSHVMDGLIRRWDFNFFKHNQNR